MKAPLKVVTFLLTVVLVLGLVQSASATGLPPPPPDEAHLGDYWFRYGPRVDKIIIPVMKDYSMRLLAFEAGKISVFSPTAADLDRIRSNRPDAHIVYYVGWTVAGQVRFNLLLWPSKYLEFRQAVAHLWDRDRIISESPLRGLAIKCPYISPATQGIFVNPNADFDKIYPYNPEKAKELLAKIFVPCTGSDGKPAWCDPKEGNKVVTLEVWSLPEATSPVYWWIAQYLKSELEKVGVRVVLRAVSSVELEAGRSAGIVPAYILGYSLGRYPRLMYSFFHSSEIRPGGWNEYRLNSSKVDELLDKFYFAKNMQEAAHWWWQVQDVLVREVVPYIPTYTSISIGAYDGKLDRSYFVFYYAPPADLPIDAIWSLTARYKDRKWGGELIIPVTTDIGTLNPAVYRWTAEGAIIGYILESTQWSYPPNVYLEDLATPVLVKHYLVEEDILHPAAKDGKAVRLTYTLFEGIKWQDGVELTAEDIAFTYLKYGKELRTRRYYNPTIDQLLEVKVINKTTVELYFEEMGWADKLLLRYYIPLPKHIYEKLSDPFADPSLISHPAIPGLTAMVGSGPWILVKREVAYFELVWNPWYYWRHPDRTVKFAAISIPSTISEGTPFKVSAALVDYLGARATNASVTVKISGPMTFTLTAAHVGAGVYEVPVPGLRAGTYIVELYAEQPIMKQSVDNKYTARITVGVAVGPGHAGPIIEKPPAISIEIPGIPSVLISLPPTVSFSPPEVKIVAPAITIESTQAISKMVETITAMPPATMPYVAVVLSIIALGVSAVVKRK